LVLGLAGLACLALFLFESLLSYTAGTCVTVLLTPLSGTGYLDLKANDLLIIILLDVNRDARAIVADDANTMLSRSSREIVKKTT
jgi:hypothetical protein